MLRHIHNTSSCLIFVSYLVQVGLAYPNLCRVSIHDFHIIGINKVKVVQGYGVVCKLNHPFFNKLRRLIIIIIFVCRTPLT